MTDRPNRARFRALLLLLAPSSLIPICTPAAVPDLSLQLVREISLKKSGSYPDLIASWSRRHGSRAVTPLLKIAENGKFDEKTRSIALLGAAQLARARAEGPVGRGISRLLRDRSWLVRLSAIKGLDVIGPSGSADAIAERLRDPALVVRSEAADSLLHLARTSSSPPGEKVLRLLAGTLTETENYAQGRALWVPRRALDALTAWKAKSQLQTIALLLNHSGDPELVSHAIQSLEKISGEPRGRIAAAEWKARLGVGRR